jgi:hypothetical protein
MLWYTVGRARILKLLFDFVKGYAGLEHILKDLYRKNAHILEDRMQLETQPKNLLERLISVV